MSQQQQDKSIKQDTSDDDIKQPLPGMEPLPESTPEVPDNLQDNAEELDNNDNKSKDKPKVPQIIKDQIRKPVINIEKAPSPSALQSFPAKVTLGTDDEFGDFHQYQSSDDDDDVVDDNDDSDDHKDIFVDNKDAITSAQISSIGVKDNKDHYSGPLPPVITNIINVLEYDDPYGIKYNDHSSDEHQDAFEDDEYQILDTSSIKPSRTLIQYYSNKLEEYSDKFLEDQVVREKQQIDLLNRKLKLCRKYGYTEDQISLMKISMIPQTIKSTPPQKLPKPIIKYDGTNKNCSLRDFLEHLTKNLRSVQEHYKTHRAWNYLVQFLSGEPLILYHYKTAIHQNRIAVFFAMLHMIYEKDNRVSESINAFFKVKQGKSETIDSYNIRKFRAL